VRSREERVQGRWKILAVITGVVLVLLILLAALEGINGHRPAQDRSVTTVVALLSVGVGALLGGVVRAAVDRYASFVESKGMAVALRAEVEAILQLVEARRYLSEVTEHISRLQNPTSTPISGRCVQYSREPGLFCGLPRALPQNRASRSSQWSGGPALYGREITA
jgi:hypothetical protein